jgi:hypothetical protein
VKPSELLDRIFNIVEDLDEDCGNVVDIKELLLDCSYIINLYRTVHGNSRV